MDPLIADLLDYIKGRHAKTGYVSSMPALAGALGFEYFEGDHSAATSTRSVIIDRNRSLREQREEAAHEITHVLADDGGYTDAIRHYHASVPDLDSHLEILTDHGADLLLMPDVLVREVLRQSGLCARSVWELSRFAEVGADQALRRLIHFDLHVHCAGFITEGNYVRHTYRNRFQLPFWTGDRMPEPHILFEHGVSLFSPPDQRGQTIGFLS